MFRIVGALCLAVLIVGVVYLTRSRTEDRQKQSYSEGVKKGSSEVAAQRHKTDSLTSLWDQERKEYRDSLGLAAAKADSTIDSLAAKLALQDEQIKKYAAQLKSRPKAKPITTAGSSTSSLSAKHQEILTYYKQRYASLPKDLSEYEMKVALAEIREETTTKYAISLSDLAVIRRKGGLTF